MEDEAWKQTRNSGLEGSGQLAMFLSRLTEPWHPLWCLLDLNEKDCVRSGCHWTPSSAPTNQLLIVEQETFLFSDSQFRLPSSVFRLRTSISGTLKSMEQARIVRQGEKLNLKEEATNPPEGMSKEEAMARIGEIAPELSRLLDLFAFSAVHPLLLVFQGMDTAGKDGAARHLFGMSSILSARVAGFKRPTEEELAHDYLWRVHKQTPGKGELVLFNRSHYEDVLVVKVHGLAPAEAIEKRYDQINAFENHLAENGTMILKFFLHISKKEQEERLLEREAEPDAAWKLSAGDWKEREKWDDYQDAYGLAMERCSTKDAPWQIIPADKKWHRNLLVTEALLKALQTREKDYIEALEKLGLSRKAELADYRA